MTGDITGNKYFYFRLPAGAGRFIPRLAARTAGLSISIYLLTSSLVLAAALYWEADRMTAFTVDSRPVLAAPAFSPAGDGLVKEQWLPKIDGPSTVQKPITAGPTRPSTAPDKEETKNLFPVYLLEENAVAEIWTGRQPVGLFLREAGIVVGPDDRLEPAGMLYPRAEIRIQREFKEILAPNRQLEKARHGIAVSCRGRAASGARDIYRRPAETVPPGKEAWETASFRGGVKNINRTLNVTATAYCPGTPGSGCPLNSRGHALCTGCYNDGYTFTGKKAVQGAGTLESPHIIAVDPRLIPLSSNLYLEGIGFAVAEDIGGAIQGNRIDLLFDLHQEARKFGLRRGIVLHILAD